MYLYTNSSLTLSPGALVLERIRYARSTSKTIDRKMMFWFHIITIADPPGFVREIRLKKIVILKLFFHDPKAIISFVGL